jgi:hypothetical protein
VKELLLRMREKQVYRNDVWLKEAKKLTSILSEAIATAAVTRDELLKVIEQSKSSVQTFREVEEEDGEVHISFGDFEMSDAPTTAASLPSKKDIDVAEAFAPSESMAPVATKKRSSARGSRAKRSASVSQRPKGGLASRKVQQKPL